MNVLQLALELHRALTVLAAALATGVLVLAPVGRLVSRPDRPTPTALRAAVDWLIVAVPLLAALAALLGVVLFAGTGGPRDGLHAVYAVVAIVTLPLARILGAGPPPDPDGPDEAVDDMVPGELTRRLTTWLALGALVTVGVLLRLAATG